MFPFKKVTVLLYYFHIKYKSTTCLCVESLTEWGRVPGPTLCWPGSLCPDPGPAGWRRVDVESCCLCSKCCFIVSLLFRAPISEIRLADLAQVLCIYCKNHIKNIKCRPFADFFLPFDVKNAELSYIFIFHKISFPYFSSPPWTRGSYAPNVQGVFSHCLQSSLIWK